MSTADSDPAGQGSLGHEVKLLVDMVLERSAPWLERDAQRVDFADHGTDRPCVGWCPICTAVNVARGQGPEFTSRAFEQAAQAVALLRAVLADRWHPEQGLHVPGFATEPAAARQPEPAAPKQPTSAPKQSPSSPSPRVQRFAVRKAEPGEQHS